MPVTLRYDGDASTYVRAAVFNTLEEALVQADHDKLVVGRQPLDVIDGRHDDPLGVVNPNVLVSETQMKNRTKGRTRPTFYTDGSS